MKSFLLCLAGGLLCAGSVFAAPPSSVPERNGFIVSEPHSRLKRIFMVSEDERPIVGMINAASNSIAAFIVECNNLRHDPKTASLQHVLPGARPALRLPPATSGNSRVNYAAMLIHQWKKIDDQRLEFTIEFTDPGATTERYSDSFVFVSQGSDWYFEKHGTEAARRWHRPRERK